MSSLLSSKVASTNKIVAFSPSRRRPGFPACHSRSCIVFLRSLRAIIIAVSALQTACIGQEYKTSRQRGYGATKLSVVLSEAGGSLSPGNVAPPPFYEVRHKSLGSLRYIYPSTTLYSLALLQPLATHDVDEPVPSPGLRTDSHSRRECVHHSPFSTYRSRPFTHTVRKAYRKKALKTHPDRLPQGASQAEKQKANEQFRLVRPCRCRGALRG